VSDRRADVVMTHMAGFMTMGGAQRLFADDDSAS